MLPPTVGVRGELLLERLHAVDNTVPVVMLAGPAGFAASRPRDAAIHESEF